MLLLMTHFRDFINFVTNDEDEDIKGAGSPISKPISPLTPDDEW